VNLLVFNWQNSVALQFSLTYLNELNGVINEIFIFDPATLTVSNVESVKQRYGVCPSVCPILLSDNSEVTLTLVR